MNDHVTFDFDGDAVRTELVDGEPWFVARDLCRCLGIETPQRAFERIPENEKGVRTAHTLGGSQDMVWVREVGLYRLVFESRKPEAERFKTWVMSVVLPSIRKTGSYGRPVLAPDAVASALSIVREARRIHGVRAARVLWADVGLPPIQEEEKPTTTTHNGALLQCVQDFLAECTDPASTASVQAEELYKAYCRWTSAAKAPLMSTTMFGRVMSETGVRKRNGRVRFYEGIRLKAEVMRRLEP